MPNSTDPLPSRPPASLLYALAIVFLISVLAVLADRSAVRGNRVMPFKGTARKTMRAFGSELELKNYLCN